MDLILWRHAEAEDGVPDLERALTTKGHNQAEAMPAWLEKRLPEDARILVSPAVRAQQTAAALPRRGKTVAAIAPGAEASSVLAAAGWPDGRESVLVVWQQPSLGEVAPVRLNGVPPPSAPIAYAARAPHSAGANARIVVAPPSHRKTLNAVDEAARAGTV